MDGDEAMEGFGREWMTVADRHRVLVECRASFPTSAIREVLMAASILMTEMMSSWARIVRAFYDDKASYLSLTVGTTDEADLESGEALRQAVFDVTSDYGEMVGVNVDLVPRGDEDNDKYCHERHLAEYLLGDPSSRPAAPGDPPF